MAGDQKHAEWSGDGGRDGLTDDEDRGLRTERDDGKGCRPIPRVKLYPKTAAREGIFRVLQSTAAIAVNKQKRRQKLDAEEKVMSPKNDAADVPSDTPPSASSKNEEKYDVIICGTDLIQSILSSALSRAGKKVLHCDGNEWYGGFDAVLHVGSTLDLFMEGCAQNLNDGTRDSRDGGGVVENDPLQLKLLPRGKCGDLKIHNQTFMCTEEESDTPTNNSGSDPSDTGLGNLSVTDEEEGKSENGGLAEENARGVVTGEEAGDLITAPTQKPDANLGHGFCFDITPSLLYASGDAVDCLIKSGVSDYVEFKSLKGLHLLMEEEQSESSPRRGRRRCVDKSGAKGDENGDVVGDAQKQKNGKELSLYRVPCTKADVYRSKLLSPPDKRRLTKFIQLISDYGIATQYGDTNENDPDEDTRTKDGDTVATDKSENANISGEDAMQSINEHYLQQGRALSRPQNKATPKSTKMDSLLRYIRDDICFEKFLADVGGLPERLSSFVLHALSLAPSGSGLTTKEGVDGLVRHLKALGRFGDTAFLVPMYGSGELSQAFCRSGAVYGSTYMLRRSPLMICLGEDRHVQGVLLSGEEHIGGGSAVNTEDVADRELSCKHVVVPSTMMVPSKANAPHKMRVYRRVSILEGKLLIDNANSSSQESPDTEQRYAFVIPPGTIGLENKSAIHGVAVDDSAFVAPRGKNYTVLHLTTSSCEEYGNTAGDMVVDAMGKTVEYLIRSQPKPIDFAATKEIHHISFSYSTETASTNEKNEGGTPGLHICYRDGQSLSCDSAFIEAKRIFQDICPDSDFLAIAQKVEDAIVFRDADDSDDEQAILEKACNMIQAPEPVTAEPLAVAGEGTGKRNRPRQNS